MSKAQLHKVITEAVNAVNSVRPADTKPAPTLTTADLSRVKSLKRTPPSLAVPAYKADPELEALLD